MTIDIKPDDDRGDDPPSINPRSHGKIPVAILSSSTFYVPASVDVSSLTFGRLGVEHSLDSCNPRGEDVNGDGLLDLVCRFTTQLTDFQPGDTQGVLRGQTVAGVAIVGTAPIRVGKRE